MNVNYVRMNIHWSRVELAFSVMSIIAQIVTLTTLVLLVWLDILLPTTLRLVSFVLLLIVFSVTKKTSVRLVTTRLISRTILVFSTVLSQIVNQMVVRLMLRFVLLVTKVFCLNLGHVCHVELTIVHHAMWQVHVCHVSTTWPWLIMFVEPASSRTASHVTHQISVRDARQILSLTTTHANLSHVRFSTVLNVQITMSAVYVRLTSAWVTTTPAWSARWTTAKVVQQTTPVLPAPRTSNW